MHKAGSTPICGKCTGYMYGTNSRFGYRRGVGTFVTSGAIRTDATAAAVSEVFREIDRLRETQAAAEELTIAKESLARSWNSRFSTIENSNEAPRELFIHALNRDTFSRALAQIQTITTADVQRAAQEHLHPEQVIVVAVGDSAKIEPELAKLNLGVVTCLSSPQGGR